MGNTAASWDSSNILAVLTAASFVIIGTLNSLSVVEDNSGNSLVIAKKTHEKTKMNNKLKLLMRNVAKASYRLLLCAVERHCCPKLLKTPYCVCYNDYGPCSLLLVSLTYTNPVP